MYRDESAQEFYPIEEERYSQLSSEEQDFQRYRDYVMSEEHNYDAPVNYVQEAPDEEHNYYAHVYYVQDAPDFSDRYDPKATQQKIAEQRVAGRNCLECGGNHWWTQCPDHHEPSRYDARVDYSEAYCNYSNFVNSPWTIGQE